MNLPRPSNVFTNSQRHVIVNFGSLENYEKFYREYERMEEEGETAIFRVKNELEPKIAQEKRSYDVWVSTDPRAEADGAFECFLDDVIEVIEAQEGTYKQILIDEVMDRINDIRR